MAAAANADQPPAVPAATTCSLSGRVCATRDPSGVAIWRKLPGGRRQPLWHAATSGATFEVADDGRSLVAIQPWANLVAADAGPATVMFTFHRFGEAPVRVTLGNLIRNLPALPRTVSHRQWAQSFGYDGPRRYLVNTVEGRHLVFDPVTGRPTAG